MKFFYSIAIALLLAMSVNAQKCKLSVEKDKFTGAVVKSTGDYSLASLMNPSGHGHFGLRQIDTAFVVDFEYYNSPNMTVGTKDAIMIKLSDGAVISIYPKDIYISKYAGSYQNFNGVYDINKADLEKLGGSPVIAYRIYYNDGYRDYDVKGKYQSAFVDAVGCLLK